MTQRTYPRACPGCGKSKPTWFEYCGRCYAKQQIINLQPNRCSEQDCTTEIPDDHFLCSSHFQDLRAGRISECPGCGEYRPAQFPLCRRCNPDHSATRAPGRPACPTRTRDHGHHEGADDRKAEDKRYWFHRQDNGVCNYCGYRYPYDQLDMEHIIPKELGGPDHRRNMQLACRSCNRKKGTSTDIEFRQLNRCLIPLEERTPPSPPIDPRRLLHGETGPRYRSQTPHRNRKRAGRLTAGSHKP